MARVVWVVVSMVSLAACGGGQQAPPAETAESHEGHVAAGRVFFVSPKDGDTIKPVSRFEFGSEGITVAAVPEGEITEAQVRAGIGHYHLGLDTGCVPVGQEIPRGVKEWIHFGTGSNNIEMSLTPGRHTFALQMGDDLHRAVEGLCETITVTVAE